MLTLPRSTTLLPDPSWQRDPWRWRGGRTHRRCSRMEPYWSWVAEAYSPKSTIRPRVPSPFLLSRNQNIRDIPRPSCRTVECLLSEELNSPQRRSCIHEHVICVLFFGH